MAAETVGNPSRLLLYLSRQPARESAADELRVRAESGERIALAAGGLWVYFPVGVARSKITPAAVDKAMGSVATGRNWNTVLKIRALLESEWD